MFDDGSYFIFQRGEEDMKDLEDNRTRKQALRKKDKELMVEANKARSEMAAVKSDITKLKKVMNDSTIKMDQKKQER